MAIRDVQNPLASLTDAQLWNVQVMLATACGRNKSSLTTKRRQYYCLVAQNLKVEADLRGLPSPSPPYSVHDVKPDPNSI